MSALKVQSRNWKSLDSNRLISKTELGYWLIKPTEVTDRTPLECPICKYLLRDQRDTNSYRIYTCCSECAMIWAEPNQCDWNEGGRPSSDAVELQLIKRFQSPIYQVD